MNAVDYTKVNSWCVGALTPEPVPVPVELGDGTVRMMFPGTWSLGVSAAPRTKYPEGQFSDSIRPGDGEIPAAIEALRIGGFIVDRITEVLATFLGWILAGGISLAALILFGWALVSIVSGIGLTTFLLCWLLCGGFNRPVVVVTQNPKP